MQQARERPREGHGGRLIPKVVTTLHSSQYSHSAVWLCSFWLVSGLAFGQQNEALLTSVPVLSLDLQHFYSSSWNSERMPGEQTGTSCWGMRDHLEQS